MRILRGEKKSFFFFFNEKSEIHSRLKLKYNREINTQRKGEIKDILAKEDAGYKEDFTPFPNLTY